MSDEIDLGGGQLDVLWDKGFALTSALEVFEPRLKGFHRQMLLLRDGEEIEDDWLEATQPFLRNEVVRELALILNQIAEKKFIAGDFISARHICKTAHYLCQCVLGESHSDTVLLENNLKLLDSKLIRKGLPSLRKFKKRKD